MGSQRKFRPLKQVRCFRCGELGHFCQECPNKREPDSLGTKHKANAAVEQCSNSDSDVVFVVSGGCVRSGGISKWLVYSGASSHMTREKELFQDYQEFKKTEMVGLGVGRTLEAVGIGNVRLRMKFKVSKAKRAVIHRVLYIPKLACNLFSVRATTGKGNLVKFSPSRCWIRDTNGKLLGMG